jgi:hypothetical protein
MRRSSASSTKPSRVSGRLFSFRQRVYLDFFQARTNERLTCEIPLVKAPSSDQLDRWELDASWLIVTTDSVRAIGYTRQNVQTRERPVDSLVVYNAVEVCEDNPDERKRLQKACKAQKLAAKQRRATRQAEKSAQKEAASS